MTGQKVGYIRVSTAEQNTTRQLHGLELDKVFEDKASGKNLKRPELEKCLQYLREGDTLFVHSVDRLARSIFDLSKIVHELSGKGIKIHFTKESLIIDNSSSPMQKAYLQMLGVCAELQVNLIESARTEGMFLAKQAGKHMGPPFRLTEDQISEIRERKAAGQKVNELAIEFKVSRATIYNYLKISQSEISA